MRYRKRRASLTDSAVDVPSKSQADGKDDEPSGRYCTWLGQNPVLTVKKGRRIPNLLQLPLAMLRALPEGASQSAKLERSPLV